MPQILLLLLKKLSVVYLKFYFRWCPAFLFAKFGNPIVWALLTA